MTKPCLFDREPPHNSEAERSVLGSMLINPQAVGTAVEVLGESGGSFYHPQHESVYNAIVGLFRRNLPADLVTVSTELQKQGHLEDAGGITAIADLTGAAPTSANVEHYSQIVLNCAIMRRLISACATMTTAAFEPGTDADEVLDGAESAIFELSNRRQNNQIYSVAELAPVALARLMAMVETRNVVNGIASGIGALDHLTCGFQPSDMIVLAARPSVGKTAFALNIAAHAALKQRKGVLMFTLEMSKEQLMYRLICSVGGVDMTALRNGNPSRIDTANAERAVREISNAPIWIDESVGLTPLDLRSRSRRHAAKHPELGLVIIDYMQLMSSGRRAESRQVEIAEISRAIKCLGRELKVPVLALSQLSRGAEDSDDAPNLKHLRESGAIEQDADVVLMLSRARKPKAGEQAPNPDGITCHISKHRNGPTGHVDMQFKKATQEFYAIGPDSNPISKQHTPYANPNFGPTDLEGGGYNEHEEDEIPFE